MKNKPHIEITGIEARFYDFFLSVGTLGFYNKLINTVIADLNLHSGERVLDMGAGTGRNALRMVRYLKRSGEIIGLEIGREMQKQFKKNTANYPNIKLIDMRIEQPISFEDKVDRVFISFVIHGFKQGDRIKIIENAYRALKDGGKIHIFDWNEFNLKEAGVILKLFFKFIECPEAKDFIAQDFKKVLFQAGFVNLEEKLYAGKKIRLLTGIKG